MSSLRGTPRASQPPNSSSKYNMKLKNFSSYILDRLPGFRRKTPMDNEEGPVPSQETSDFDLQRKGTKIISERNSYNNSSGQFKVPPLLPSLSEPKISSKNGTKSNISAKSTKKILVSASSSGHDNSPSGNKPGTKSTSTSRSNSPSKSAQPSRTPQSEYASIASSSSGLRKKHSPTSPSQQDYSGSSSTTAGSESGAYEPSPRYISQSQSVSQSQFSNQYNQYRGGHSAAQTTSSPNVVIFGNNSSNNYNHNNNNSHNTEKGAGRSTTAALLSQMGFPMGKSSEQKNNNVAASHVITVKPASSGSGTARSRDRSPSPAPGTHQHQHSNNHTNSTNNINGANPNSGSAPSSEKTSPATAPTPSKAKALCCDKCDGKHETDNCPYYKKSRDDHPDAQKNKQIGGVSSLPGNTLYAAKVVRQPGDGSCLFHSMSYGLPNKSNATRLRAEICNFIQNNPHLKISDTPLQDWVKWDANSSVSEYARRMSRGSWGGGIEMACLSLLKEVNVHVYERSGLGFKRISAFDHPQQPEHKPIVRVLYCGGVHYDAIVTAGQ